MTLNFITITHLCETCIRDGENDDCGGVSCRLRILEAEDGKVMNEEEDGN